MKKLTKQPNCSRDIRRKWQKAIVKSVLHFPSVICFQYESNIVEQVGCGGFGGPRSNPAIVQCEPVPKRAPNVVVEQRTNPDAAALYRQGSGDLNPLHIDASFAALLGAFALVLFVYAKKFQALKNPFYMVSARSVIRCVMLSRRLPTATIDASVQ